MAFAPDVHVFPGGRVDDADADPRLIARSVLAPADAGIAIGGDLAPEPAIAACIAVIREAFEEAGVLLADLPPGSRSTRRDLARARAALVGGEVGFGSLVEQLDLTLRTDRLASIGRWVTPPVLPRRFDTRFFAAALPDGEVATIEGDEVVDQVWIRPTDALTAMADGLMAFWVPTSATLQQLEHVAGLDDVQDRMTAGTLGPVLVDSPASDVIRIEMPAGGGVAGQPVNAYLVGRRSLVLVDPGDPVGPALERAVVEASARGGSIVAIALTHADPDHHGGAETLAEILGVPILAGPGAGRALPFDVLELADGQTLDAGDVPIRAVHTPGPRSDHVAYVVGDGASVLIGDLDGTRGARSVSGPADDLAWAASLARIAATAPDALRLGGHPARD